MTVDPQVVLPSPVPAEPEVVVKDGRPYVAEPVQAALEALRDGINAHDHPDLVLGTDPRLADARQPADLSVTNGKLATDAVDGRVLAPGAVGPTDIADAAVQQVHLGFTVLQQPDLDAHVADITAVHGFDDTDKALVSDRYEIDLEILRTVAQDVTLGTTAWISCYGPSSGALWFCTNDNRIAKSTDDGLTLTLVQTVPGYTIVEQLLELRSGTLLAVARDAGTQRYIIRSTDAGVTWSAPVFTFPAATSAAKTQLLSSQSWWQRDASISNDVFFGQYGGTGVNNPMGVYKSADDGLTWSLVFQWTDIRHIHSIWQDPYARPGQPVPLKRIWACIGDTGLQPRIGYSDNEGVSWTFITAGDGTVGEAYRRSRAVGLMFTPSYVFWFSDIPEYPARLYRYDPQVAPNAATGAGITKLLDGLVGSFMMAFSFRDADGDDLLCHFSAIEPAFNWKATDDYTRVYGSVNGKRWRSLEKWARNPADNTTNANLTHGNTVVLPDGSFWIARDNLDGTQDFTSSINVKYRFRKKFVGDAREPLARERWARTVEPQVFSEVLLETYSASSERDLMYAHFDMKIVALFFTVDATLAADASNFWQLQLRKWSGGAYSGSNVATLSGAATALTLNTPIAPPSISGPFVKAGQLVRFFAFKTGTPGNLVRPAVHLYWRRVNQVRA